MIRTIFLYGFPIVVAMALVLMVWTSWILWFYPDSFDKFLRMTWSDLFVKLKLKRNSK